MPVKQNGATPEGVAKPKVLRRLGYMSVLHFSAYGITLTFF